MLTIKGGASLKRKKLWQIPAVTLPEAINSAGIKANFKNGVLETEVPKAEGKKPKQISINVE